MAPVDSIGVILFARTDRDAVLHRVQEKLYILHVLKFLQAGGIETQLSVGDRHGWPLMRGEEISTHNLITAHIETFALNDLIIRCRRDTLTSRLILLCGKSGPVLVNRNITGKDASVDNAENR